MTQLGHDVYGRQHLGISLELFGLLQRLSIEVFDECRPVVLRDEVDNAVGKVMLARKLDAFLVFLKRVVE